MIEKKPSAASIIKDFFGYLPGQKLSDFAAELKALSDEDKSQLVGGIQDGTLTY